MSENIKRSMVISIIGRPNVGKSSLFNRLMKRANKNITFDTPGVTRDRHYGITSFDELAGEEQREAIVIDTGGFYPEKVEEENGNNKFFNIMIDHAKMAILESDIVLLVVDIREGLIPFDEGIVNYLRGIKKKFWLVINKYDSDKQMGYEADFYTLGIPHENMYLVSSAHGVGMNNLFRKLNEEILCFENSIDPGIVPKLQKGVTPREKVVARLAIVGAPNAGKSTLLNKLVGSQRALVSDVPGTTVDPIEGFFDLYFGKEVEALDNELSHGESRDLLIQQYEEFQRNNIDFHNTMITKYQKEGEIGDMENDEELLEALIEDGDSSHNSYDDVFVEEVESEIKSNEESGSFWRTVHLVDTAGIRRQKSVDGFVESQSVFRSLRSITEADIVIFMIDAVKGIGHQDSRLMDIALEKGKSLIVCLNKVDLLKDKIKTKKDRKNWLEDLRYKVPWLDFCELIPVSAKHGTYLGRVKNAIKETILVRKGRVSTAELNRTVFDLVEKNPVVAKRSGGKRLKVRYSSMVKSAPPTFILFTNCSKGIPENYRRYLRNGLRHEFSLLNTPVHLIFRTGSDLEKRRAALYGKESSTS
ncbi:MAG: 50S ribosome-binding GTPase [Bacteriovoracaceae bacterium]|nr:50S ribosome-binding GTPase [Bacteriovoracaceae bacterium]